MALTQKNPMLVENYRPSLAILGAISNVGLPRNRSYANRTFEQARNLMSQPVAALNPSFSNVMGKGGSEFERLVNAIAGKESGGNYRAVNRHSGALGKYQIMPGNLPSWSRKYLGRVVSRSEFLSNPAIQEQIARAQLLEYYRRYGAAGAATAWYAGPGAVGRPGNRSQGAYPTINQYTRAILSRL